uniref:neuralized-like protein 2 isoform X2 n=1 Tax=Myxine glutinosa TaxID=7769 RepID=UPI00358E6722
MLSIYAGEFSDDDKDTQQTYARFHRVHGQNVMLSDGRTRSTRLHSFAGGVCFSEEPLCEGRPFVVEIAEKENGWCGHLRLGLTSRDPARRQTVPESSLPDMANSGEAWIVAITRGLSLLPDSGEMGPTLQVGEYLIPREKLVGRSLPGRYSHVLDAAFHTGSIPATARGSRVGVLYTVLSRGPHVPSLKTLCRQLIQRRVSHRMDIDDLSIPEALKNYCKLE